MKIENKIENNIKNKRKINMTVNMKLKNKTWAMFVLIVTAGLILDPAAVFAVGDSTDVGLTTGVTNLLAILNNKLTPVVLIAGCLASLVYSFAIAQPKPFILGVVTLCGFGFAKAWISGTYALVG